MIRRTASWFAALVVIFASLSALVAGDAQAAARELNSYNWAGYAVRGPVVDAVVLEFTVPTVTCTQSNQALSVWAGLGGLREQSLVQAGVQVICDGTNPRYSLFEQLTNGTGASTEGPQVSPGDYVRVVVCPTPSGSSTGVCRAGAPSSAYFMTSVAVKRGGVGDYQVWSQSLTPKAWFNTRAEAECIVERPRDAATLTLLEAPQFSMPAMRCVPYRSINPITRVDVAQGGSGYSAYRLRLVPGSPDEPRAAVDGPALEPGRLDPLDEPERDVTTTGSATPQGSAPMPAQDVRPNDIPLGGSPFLLSP